jgi:ABA4-like protein
VLAAVYVAIILTTWAGSSGGFTSLSAVATLFSNPWLLLAGWTHYLAFDLLVGSWEVRDARDRGVPHLLVLPCLALTFLFGPAGWLLYLGMRSLPRRSG